MRYRDATRDAGAPILDHYTGVGEVLAVHELDRVFGLLHRRIRVKRGSLFSLDDAKNNNLIFIGSPVGKSLAAGNSRHPGIRISSSLPPGLVKGTTPLSTGIHNPTKARNSSQLLLVCLSPRTTPFLGLVKGMNPGQSVLILAGNTTIGTQAAVEYVCRQSSVEELLLRLSVSQNGELKPFEAVIRVKVARGVPVETELVAIRKSTT